MRFLAAFLAGAGAGALVVFLLMRDRVSPVQAPSHRATTRAFEARPSRQARAKTEEEIMAERAGIPLSTAQTPAEQAISDEPQRVVPPVDLPPGLSADTIVIPVAGVGRGELHDMFHERRGLREHQAIDIMAPRGTPVLAAIDGTVAKLFLSKAGGITVYEYDPARQSIYYYAHLDAYAPGLAEGQALHRGEVIGFVGTTGNAPPDAPHLHFSIEKLLVPGQWWKSEAIDPYPILASRGVTVRVAR